MRTMETCRTARPGAAQIACGLGLGLLGLSGLGGCLGGDGQSGKAPVGEIHALAVDQVPIEDPRAAAWERAPESAVTLLPQSIVYPMLGKASIGGLRVRALLDPRWLGLRLEWADPTGDDKLEVDKFTDAVAVEIPLGDPAQTNPMMGGKDNPVYICHWKAAWQRDVDRGRADVQDYHPGYTADPYPFVSGRFPYEVQESFQSDNARRYFAGTSAGNPVSKLYRRWPVEELHAEGFGSVADHSLQDAQGKGVYRDGKWQVVLALPRQVSDGANPAIPSGGSVLAAFAVWDGGSRNVGGRKHWAPFNKVVLP